MYKFLTTKCKEKGVRIDDLPKLCNFSRSTLYRYMKGIVKMTPEVEELFINILKFNNEEKTEFSNLVALNAFDESLVNSRYVLDKFIFSPEDSKDKLQNIDFAYYENDKYLRNISEILDEVYVFFNKSDLICHIKILNCTNEPYFAHTIKFLKTLFLKRLNIYVEHIFSMPEKEYERNLKIFLSLMPFLSQEYYKIYYTNENSYDSCSFINNLIMIEITYTENGTQENKNFVISFLNEGLSQCIKAENDYFYSFLKNHYANAKNRYNLELKTMINEYNSFSKNPYDIKKENEELYIIKTNLSFRVLFSDVLEEMDKKNSENTISSLNPMYNLMPKKENMFSAKYIEELKDNNSILISSPTISFASKSGFLFFVTTGKLVDQPVSFPALNKDEIKSMLTCIRDMNLNNDNNYNLFILNEDIYCDDVVITVYKNSGVTINYATPLYSDKYSPTIYIQDKCITKIFTDYFEQHISRSHTYSKNDTTEFLNHLIDNYLQ